jgi:hypothetical protein
MTLGAVVAGGITCVAAVRRLSVARFALILSTRLRLHLGVIIDAALFAAAPQTLIGLLCTSPEALRPRGDDPPT